MRFPKYPQYQDSNVDWLGPVPSRWNLRSFRYSARIKNGCDFKQFEVTDGGYPVMGSGGEFGRVSRFLYDKPSVLLGRKGTIDNPLFIDKPFWTVDTLFYTEVFPTTNPKFLYYFCRNIPFGFFQYGSAVPSMTQNDIYEMIVPVPPIEEQRQIASFLDQETAKIDALITDQQRLIELLKEKRQAVISYAVTKGLNPDVRMKPSGVEWLGEVPEHWPLIPLKYCVKLATEKAEDNSFPIALENVQSWTGHFLPGDGDFSGEGVSFQLGDILFGKLRPYLAKAFLAERSGQAIGDFHVLRPTVGVLSHWLQYRILSREFIDEINSASFGTKMPRVSWEFMGGILIPLPPKEDQQAIVSKLNGELRVLDSLVLDAQKSITLLQERRTALISAAVTGKIDVRNYASTQQDTA